MGVAQKTMFSISDRLVNFFGISGAPMDHNAIAKSKQTFFLQKSINGPGLIAIYRLFIYRITLDTSNLTHTVVTIVYKASILKY